MSTELLLSWILMCLVGDILPGLDFVYIVNTATHSRRCGVIGGLGVMTGVAVHSLVATFGAVALFTYAHGIFLGIQFLGSLYILRMGLQIGWPVYKRFYQAYLAHRALQRVPPAKRAALQARIQRMLEGKALITSRFQKSNKEISALEAFFKGLLVNLLNPKCFLFMITVMPQFVTTQASVSVGMQFFVLSLSNIILGLLYWTLLAYLVDLVAKSFASPRFVMLVDLISSLVLIALGLSLFYYNMQGWLQ